MATIHEQLRKAQQQVEKQKTQSQNQSMQAMATIGSTILGAVFGRKLTSATNIGRVATGVRAATKLGSERQDVAMAEDNVDAIQSRCDALNQQFEQESTDLLASAAPENLRLEEISVSPKKTDVQINKLVLCWTPWIVGSQGKAQQGW